MAHDHHHGEHAHDHDAAHGHGSNGHDHDGHDHDGHDHDGHDHDHRDELRRSPGGRLTIALALTTSFLVIEALAGVLSNSLALLSDAGHMLTDAGALALALYAQRLASRARTSARTFGYRRAEILAALLNGAVLGMSALWIIVEAVQRFRQPSHEVHGLPMLVVAGLGLVVNLIAAWVLSRGGHGNTNVRAAAAHVLADAAGSVAAIVAAVLVLGPGWTLADPVVSILISLLVLWGAWRLVREAVDVLMESTPAGVDLHALEEVIRTTPGVASVHDLHVWSISEGFPVITVHVVLDGSGHGTDVARAVAQRVKVGFGIDHVTVQPEAPEAKLVPVTALLERRQGRTR